MNPRTDSSSQFSITYGQRIQNLLEHHLNSAKNSTRVNEALIYSVLSGGKRIRPLLIYATGLDLNAKLETLDNAAVAVELLHCYSLIHDDLPAMDDDELRRGKATCHIAFDEATAILAGDALQSLAFEILSLQNSCLKASTQLAMIHSLAQAIGPQGMAAGQMLDLQAENRKLNLNEMENIHRLKTGALISSCLELGGLAAETNSHILEELRTIGFALGLAFQIQDDILDIETSTEILGKKNGADTALNKSTYPKLLGMEAAKLRFQQEYQNTLSLIEKNIPRSQHLAGLVRQLVERKY